MSGRYEDDRLGMGLAWRSVSMIWNRITWMLEVYRILKDHAGTEGADLGRGLEPRGKATEALSAAAPSGVVIRANDGVASHSRSS